MPYEQWINKDHKCRTGCRHPMPLPESQGKECPNCGHRQPTYEELMARAPEVFKTKGTLPGYVR